ncbi:PQQ-binding-like beta-propeller repeat protein, partial [bacterium]|nr:PQQ-binding-like beta-propeller repeat protein [bacterium]
TPTFTPNSDFDPWPMFHYDLKHTGVSPFKGPETPMLRWTFPTGVSNVRGSSAIDAEGTNYFGSYDRYIYAVNPNGTLKWSFLTDMSLNSSPALAYDGTIYIGSLDYYLYAMNSDGTVKWKYQTGMIGYSSPAINPDDGTIYVGDETYGSLWAVNPDGTFKWSYKTGAMIKYSSPAVGDDGTIYIGSNDHFMYAINPDGTLKWKFLTGGEITSPAIENWGTIYFGSFDNYLYALHSNGCLKWKFETGNDIYSSPAIAFDGTIYIGSFDHYLYAVNPDGTLKWKYETGDIIRVSSPAIDSEGTVYVGSFDHKLYAIKSDGTLKWTYEAGDQIDAPPSIGADGTIYFGCKDNYFYAIQDAAATPTITKTPTLTPTPTITGSITETPTATPSSTLTPSPTQTFPFITPTPTITWSPNITQTPTQTSTNLTETPTPTLSKTPTLSPTPTWTVPDMPVLSDGQFSPETGDIKSSFDFRVHYTDPDGGFPLIKRLYINDIPQAMSLDTGNSWDGFYTKSITGNELNLGNNEFYFLFGDDEFNNIRLPSSGTFDGPIVTPEPDKVPPVVTIISPKDSENVAGKIKVSATAQDVSGISSVQVKCQFPIKIATWEDCQCMGNRWDLELDTKGYPDMTEVTIRARATDASDNSNIGYSSEITIIVRKFVEEYWVGAEAPDNRGTGSQIDPWRTITYALSKADGGQYNPVIIHVLPGTYDLTLGEIFPLELKSYVTLDSTEEATTVIDATVSGTSVISCINNTDAGINKFTITGGEGLDHPYYGGRGYGGGILCYNSSLRISNCTIRDNSSSYGGGIFIENLSPEIIGCTVENNTSQWGGGITCFYGSPMISDTNISNNNADRMGYGGGLFFGISNPTLANCKLSGNTARRGGGIFCKDSGLSIRHYHRR